MKSKEEIIEELKKHLNVDFPEDDDLIYSYYLSAVACIEVYLQAPLDDYRDSNGDLMNNIVHAIRLLVGTWYAFREDAVVAATTTLPMGVSALLTPMKRFDRHSQPREE